MKTVELESKLFPNKKLSKGTGKLFVMPQLSNWIGFQKCHG